MTLKLNESFVLYEFICPGCNAIYVGKTGRTLRERCDENAWNDKDSVVFKHLNECISVQHMFEIGKLTPSLLTVLDLNIYQLIINWYLTKFIVLHFSC